ncbi:MAG: hypothetical protein RQ758_09330 [Methanomicrobiaceae archaeon]|nr:hypothetical protein [Methanomicrobiaceae archaeon]
MSPGFLRNLLEHEQLLVLLLIPLFIAVMVSFVPGDLQYWTTYWWIFPVAVLFDITVNVPEVSGASLFVPFLQPFFPCGDPVGHALPDHRILRDRQFINRVLSFLARA